jgi:hypothetical protein
MASNKVADPGVMNVSARTKTIYSVLIFLGLIGFILTVIREPVRAWHGYLLGYFYFTTLAVGGLFFASLQHMTSAGWSVNIRRIVEALTAFMPVVAIGGVILLIFGKQVYPWLRPDVVAADELLQHKSAYLNMTFFTIRMVVFIGLWLLFTKLIVGRSLKQDQTGDDNLTLKLMRPSVIFAVVFALSYSLFSVDTLMSLEPHWFSTIFGVYCFSGLFQSTMAATILITIYFIKKGQLRGFVDENHLHDLGKFLFGFTVFWAYIAFSQFMLIWYANLPEETIFYMPRMAGSWMWVSLFLLIFKFVVPFFALLPRWAKRNHAHLIAVSILILVMQFVDIYWLIFPNLNEEEVVFSFNEILIFCGFAGLFLFCLTRFLSRHSIVPYKDGRIEESLHHHVVY